MENKLKKYGFTKQQIAEIFEYSSVKSLYRTSAKEKVYRIADRIVSEVERKIIEKLKA
jgi:hypothetical protein